MSEQERKYIIAGLGNPGLKYKNTRHNFGFMVIDYLADKLGVSFRRMKHQAMISKAHFGDNLVILAKPRTYMNNSGQSIRSLVNFYKVSPQNVLIIFDDADLDYEVVRIRKTGSSSGQKGMASIIQALGTQDIPRLRLGLGRPAGRLDTADFVLQPFSKEEKEILPFILNRASEAALTFINEGIDAAMNQFNPKAL